MGIPQTKTEPCKSRPTWTKDRLFEELKVHEMPLQGGLLDRMKDILWQNRDCFSIDEYDLGKCNFYKASIPLKPDAKPVHVPPIPIPYKHRDAIDEHLEGMERSDIIKRTDGSSFWHSRVFLVPKPHQPGKLRFVADFRCLNAQCLPDTYQLPNINHVADRIGGAKWYSTFDLSKSFFQLEYDEKSKPLTSFSVNGKWYMFQRMVMGHCNSSSQFARMMDNLLENIPLDQLCYFLDDLCLASSDIPSHLSKLNMVLGRLGSANLKLLPKKCHFLRSSVTFCGLTLSKDGKSIDADRVEAVKKVQPPKTVREAQSLMGFLSYNRPFVSGFASLSKPLYDLIDRTQPRKRLRWSEECNRNLEEIKRRIAAGLTLSIPRVDSGDNTYVVTLDGAQDGFGAQLEQWQEGELKTVAYFSKRTPKHKRIWSQAKLEFETLIETLLHWYIYLRGVKFLVKTDCLSLLSLERLFAKSDATMIRRLNKIIHFRFDIEHVAGVDNTVADFLSRFIYNRRDCDASTQTLTVTNCDTPDIPTLTDSCTGPDTDSTAVDSSRVTNVAPDTCLKNNQLCEELSVHVIESRDTAEQVLEHVSGPEKEEDFLDKLVPDSFLESDWQGGMDHAQKWTGDDITQVLVKNVEPELDSCICNHPHDDTYLHRDEPTLVVQAVSADRTPISNGADTMPHLLDLKEVAESQKTDPILRKVREWLNKGEKPKAVQATRTPPDLIRLWKQFDLLTIRQDIICRKWVKRDRKTNEIEVQRCLIIVPEDLRGRVMTLYHCTRITAHPGVDETYRQCLTGTWWPKMRDEIELFVKACVTCGRVKPPQAYLKAPLMHVIAHDRHDVLCIDHIVPERDNMTPRRNRYILVLTDVFTGYVMCLPTRTTKAEEVIRLILHHWILRPGFGTPKEIIADNATSFTALYYDTICAAFGVKSTHGTAYKCSSTAKVERANRSVNTALRIMLTDRQLRDWDLYLDFVSAALNARRSRHTGFTSNYLMHGKEINNPLSLTVDNEPVNFEPGVKYSAKAYALYKTYRTILRKARRHAEADFRYADNYYNKNLHGPYFKEGDWCYTLIECVRHKFSQRWKGPYRIIKSLGPHLYVLDMGNGKDKLVNVSKLKSYRYSRFSPEQLGLDPDAQEFLPAETIVTPSHTPVDISPAGSVVEIEFGQKEADDDNAEREFPTMHEVAEPQDQEDNEPDHVTDCHSDTVSEGGSDGWSASNLARSPCITDLTTLGMDNSDPEFDPADIVQPADQGSPVALRRSERTRPPPIDRLQAGFWWPLLDLALGKHVVKLQSPDAGIYWPEETCELDTYLSTRITDTLRMVIGENMWEFHCPTYWLARSAFSSERVILISY